MATNKRKSKDGKKLRTGEYLRNDGRYEYRKCVRGQKIVIYASSLVELRKKEDEFNKEQMLGVKNSSKCKTVNDMYDKWKSLKRGLKPNTLQNYLYMYDKYVKSTLGNRTLKDVKKSDMVAFYGDLIDNKGLSIKTIECVQTVLYQIFEMAMDDDLILKNPTTNSLKGLKREKNQKETKKMGLTKDEEHLLIRFLKQSNKFGRWYPLVVTMLYTGMRFGEASSLRWCDVDFDKNVISVNHAAYYFDKGKVDLDGKHCGFTIQMPKTKTSIREFPMLDIVKEALMLEKQRQEELEIKCTVNIDGYTDFIFCNQKGNLYTDVAVNRALKSIIKHCNNAVENNKIENNGTLLPADITNHTFRHTFATRLCESGVNPKATSEILGHSDISTTMNIYTDATKDFMFSEMGKIDFSFLEVSQ